MCLAALRLPPRVVVHSFARKTHNQPAASHDSTEVLRVIT
jgi:hypothetical protein